MKQLKICKGVTKTPLKHLNEGEVANNKKYEFTGIFTQCSTPDKKIVNRNNRVYMEKEVLRHLGYLREMIEEQGGILGELDHPEGRFDVQMQNASHMITDLWYDDRSKCVMGKLKVLDTPNGKILRELIDAGYPLYVSSRAAGDVNEKTKEVEIAQIFTYDVVCTPGFKEAKLERINESLSSRALKYINESVSAAKTVKEDVIVEPNVINEEMIEKFAFTRIKDVNKPLNEEDASETPSVGMLPVMDGNTSVKEDGDDESEEEKEEKEDSEEKDDEKDSEGEDEEKDDEDDKDDALSDEEKEENRKLILDIVGVVDDEEATEEDSEDEEDEEDEEGDDKDDKDDKDEKKEDIVDIEAKEKDDDSENESKHKCKSAEQIQKEAEKDIDDYEALLSSIQKTESVKESIIARYPFAISLSEANFAKFASLRPKLKKRCADFIEEYQIYDVNAINELWSTPLREDKRMQQNWLRLASKTDIDLYCQAPLEIQNAIEEQAQMIPMETQEDVDLFWERMGLRRANASRMLNERMNQRMKDAQTGARTNNSYNLGYSQDWIAMAEEMMK